MRATLRSRAGRSLAAVVAVASVALVGCEKPTPSVTVFSGSSSDHRPAVCWSPDGQQIDTQKCLSVSGPEATAQAQTLTESLGSVPVRANATIGVSVDPEVADRGWFVALGTNRVNVNPITDTYFKFSLPANVVERSSSVPLYVFAVSPGSDQVTGVWAFELVPAPGE